MAAVAIAGQRRRRARTGQGVRVPAGARITFTDPTSSSTGARISFSDDDARALAEIDDARRAATGQGQGGGLNQPLLEAV
jgi:hypothetical protein